MLSFFKKKKKELEDYKQEGENSAVSSKELLNEEDTLAAVDEKEVQTELSIHPEWNLNAEDRYVFKFMVNDLPPLKPNQISLSGIELSKDMDSVVVSAFIRNSLHKGISFKQTKLLLLGKNGEALARKEFDLSHLGELPARSSRPWTFIFNKADLLVEENEIPATGWKLAFELKSAPPKHRLDLEESWEKNLTDEDKAKLAKIVEDIGQPKAEEVNFMGIQANVRDNNLHVMILIRNGSQKNINLEQIPLIVEDVSGVIAKGGFTLEKFEVKANTSKPWTFIFPESLLAKKIEEIDLSKWKVYPPQQN